LLAILKTKIGIIKRQKLILKTSHAGKPSIAFENSEFFSGKLIVEFNVTFPRFSFNKKQLTLKIENIFSNVS